MSVPAARLEVVNVRHAVDQRRGAERSALVAEGDRPAVRSGPARGQVADRRGERDRLADDRRSGRGGQRREGRQGTRRADGHGHRRRDLADHVVTRCRR